MESHPEEFKRSLNSRWYDIIGEINAWGDEADKAAINAKLRDIRLGEAHEDMMDELLNGPERRRKQEEEQEYERQMLRQGGLVQQQKAYVSQIQGMAGQVYGGGAGLAQGVYDADLDMYRNATSVLPVANGGTAATTGTLTNTINQIREMLGTKK
jgi:hypothetical protein